MKVKKKNPARKSHHPQTRIVNFAICGTQKGGTSALDTYLRGHPEICMADRKEVHFFDNEAAFATGKPDYSRYHSFFSPNDTQRILGESTPIYMYWKPAPTQKLGIILPGRTRTFREA